MINFITTVGLYLTGKNTIKFIQKILQLILMIQKWEFKKLMLLPKRSSPNVQQQLDHQIKCPLKLKKVYNFKPEIILNR